MGRVSKPMDAKERALWEDAEGCLIISHSKAQAMEIPELRTGQLERGILEDYCEGARKDGVNCVVRAYRAAGKVVYLSRISDLKSIA